MTTILAYCDPTSAAPGDAVRFMVSCEGAAGYEAEIVRLINPQAEPEATPFRVEPVATPASRSYRARIQKLRPGSYAMVEPHPAVERLESWSLRVFVWPTTPGRRRQALLGAWSEPEQRGFGLFLDERGAAEARIGNGAGGIARLSTGAALRERCWYLVAASFDAASGRLELSQAPVSHKTFQPDDARAVSDATMVRPACGGLPFLLAAWHEGPSEAPGAERPILAGGHLNGKLDRPRLANRALGSAEMAALGADTLPDDRLGSVVAAWDFSLDIPGETIVDVAPNRMHGRIVNLPARAMTGHNWTGEAMDWTQAPGQYGAIHFHDDDLVDAGWQEDFRFEVPQDLRSGVYAARLCANEAEFWVPFFVRPPKGHARGKVAFLASTATYTVYMNNRARFTSIAVELYQGRLTVMDAIDQLLLEHPGMGLSTYDRHADGSGVCYASRHRPVTNFRPTGRHWNFNLDLFIVDWLEHLGADYDVITEEDLHEEGWTCCAPTRWY
jgi:N,N-dimethylformamidase